MAKQEQVSASQPLEKELLKPEGVKPMVPIADSIQQLTRFGGFEFIKSIIDGTENLDPNRRAVREIFLTEDENKKDRQRLKQRLESLVGLFESRDDVTGLIEAAQEKGEESKKTLNKNLAHCLTQTEALERSYRALSLFFENTEAEKVKNLTLVDTDTSQLSKEDSYSNPGGVYNMVAKDLRLNYDNFDLEGAYSMLVLPGWLGKNVIVDKWAKLAHENKVMLLTDYRNLDSAETVETQFDKDKLTGADAHKANVIMTSNWIAGREAYTEAGETEPLYVYPSLALAGMLWAGLISQPSAGLTHGKVQMATGVRFSTRRNEVAQLENQGLVPMTYNFGRVIPMSARTLFNGDNVGYQTYSVVRVFDWIAKVFQDFLSRRTFEVVNNTLLEDIKFQISTFLNEIRGDGKIIEAYDSLVVQRHPDKPTHVIINVRIKPFFPAKVFEVKLTGTKGDWSADLK